MQFVIQDTSSSGNGLALLLHSKWGDLNGNILVLPDFKSNNGNVALALLQEIIPAESPHLFDEPKHGWLKDYQPAPVLKLEVERENLIEEALRKIEEIDRQCEAEREKFAWLSGLLVSSNDQFETDAAQAFRFLGFDVEEVDKDIAIGDRKREDYRIRDNETDFFALGEAKTVGKARGASEGFIGKTQNHQATYSREYKQVIPPALLIVNFAIDLDPSQRAGQFYQPEVAERLESNGITAINSVALFNLCQWVLDGRITKKQARTFITQGRPIINTVTIEDVSSCTF